MKNSGMIGPHIVGVREPEVSRRIHVVREEIFDGALDATFRNMGGISLLLADLSDGFFIGLIPIFDFGPRAPRIPIRTL